MQLTEWSTASPEEAEQVGRDLGKRLAAKGCVFVGVEPSRFEDREVRSLLFDIRGSRFALVAGGKVSLGFDVAAFQPSQAVRASYSRAVREFGFPRALDKYLKSALSPRREVVLAPMLVEVDAQRVGHVPISTTEPRIAALLERAHIRDSYEVAGKLRVERAKDGTYRAWLIQPTSREALVSSLEADGFRLPTSDEWELACGAGRATLFRWGDSCPMDRNPVDEVIVNPTVLRPVFSLNRAPNAFGLHIAEDPYRAELVAEPEVLRGGDGGEAVCGDYGAFLSWLPLATAYCDAEVNRQMLGTGDTSSLWYRRVLDVD